VNAWIVDLRPSARKDLRRLPSGPRQAALEVLDELREHGPGLVEAFQLRGYKDTWRVRFHHEDYRMIYEVSRSKRRIDVTKIRPRSIAYEGMKS
jgi:mRNA-degrading endonuclease RelE of RelBE toxin-antitoxin system